MIERYALIGGCIRQELQNLERVVKRVEGAMDAARKRPEDQDFYLDSAALSLHDLYAGLERVFHYIASHVEQSAPTGGERRRELLRQMMFWPRKAAYRSMPVSAPIFVAAAQEKNSDD